MMAAAVSHPSSGGNAEARAPSTLDADFVRVRGIRYLDFLRAVHERQKPQCYLEVGTNRGRSIVLADCASIAIDPVFRLTQDVLGSKPELHLFQMTSDDAFASDRMQGLGLTVDLAFLDGLHLFEFLLRDFINTEKCMAEGGVIFMHDTAPFDHEMTGRDFLKGLKSWTGDVWKILPILAKYRPELDLIHLDCKPTGLAMVRGPWGQSDALEKHYDAIVDEFSAMDLARYGPRKFYAEHAPQSAAGALDALGS